MKDVIKLLLMFVLLLALVVIGSWGVFKLPTVVNKKTDTVHIIDTVFCDIPVVRDSIVTKYVTRWLVKAPDRANALEPTAETCSTESDEPPDSVEVVLPITQKVYADNNYTAWVSGYEASLDSIRIYKQTEVIMQKKQHRWGVMIGAGAGINTKGQATPMIGVMVGYKIF